MKLLLTCLMTFCMSSMISFSTTAQSEIPTHKKIVRLLTAEHDIYRLGFNKEYVLENILPDIEHQRSLLAPHYPELLTNNQDEKYNALENWIVSYQNEYEAFVLYYETLIRSYL